MIYTEQFTNENYIHLNSIKSEIKNKSGLTGALVFYSARINTLNETVENTKDIFDVDKVTILCLGKQVSELKNYDYIVYSNRKYFKYNKECSKEEYSADVIAIPVNDNDTCLEKYIDILRISCLLKPELIFIYYENGYGKIFYEPDINNILKYCKKEKYKNKIQKKLIHDEVRGILKLDKKTITRKFEVSSHEAVNDWNKIKSKSGKNIDKYYATTKHYIFELLKENNYYGARCTLFPEIKKHLKKCDSILDFGSGVGNLGLYLKLNGYSNIFLADINSPVFEFAKQRFKIRNLTFGSIGLPQSLPEEYFNAVICLDVIEHLYDPVSALKNIHNSLKPCGLLILQICFKKNEHLPMHINKLKKSECYTVMKQIGFKILSPKSRLLKEEALIVWQKK